MIQMFEATLDVRPEHPMQILHGAVPACDVAWKPVCPIFASSRCLSEFVPAALLYQTKKAFNLLAFPVDYVLVVARLLADRLQRNDRDIATIRKDQTRPVVRTALVHHGRSDLWPVPHEQFPTIGASWLFLGDSPRCCKPRTAAVTV